MSPFYGEHFSSGHSSRLVFASAYILFLSVPFVLLLWASTRFGTHDEVYIHHNFALKSSHREKVRKVMKKNERSEMSE